MSSLVCHCWRRQLLATTANRSQRRKLERPVAPGLQCCLSTNSAGEKKKPVPKSLYRQLLRLCDSTYSKVPLGSLVDPMHVAPPHVDKEALEVFKRYKTHEGIYESTETNPSINDVNRNHSHIDKAYQYLPQTVSFDPDEEDMTVSIHNMDDLRGFVRTMFRVNAVHPGDDEVNQARLTYGLEAVSQLNNLAESLKSLDRERENNRDRKEVLYHVGQVVQHKFVRWRGVVVGWKTPDYETKDDASFKSKAPYTDTNNVQYEVLLDRAGVHVRHASASLVVSKQENWELVTDPSLCRIWNNQIPKYFKGYQSHSNTFQMNDFLAYRYPVDHSIQQLGGQSANEDIVGVDPNQIQLAVEELGFGIGGDVGLKKHSHVDVDLVAKETVTKVKQFTETLHDFLSQVINANQHHELGTLEVFREMFDFSGDATPQPPAASSVGITRGDGCPITSASAHVHQLLESILELREVLQHRKKLRAAENIRFELGQVVYHEYLGIRGLVVGIDPLPKVDVSHWAGTGHLENPGEHPFYYIYPDEQDSLRVFGVPFGERYMCQANLRPCEGDERDDVFIPLARGWQQEFGEDGAIAYVPPSFFKFKHGVDIGDNNLTEQCLTKVESAISSWQIHAKENKFFSPRNLREILGPIKEEPVDCGVSLFDLMKLLRGSRTMVDAITFDEAIKDIFKAHPSRELRSKLEEGIAHHLRGNYKSAMEIFQCLVAQDTEYAEAWNKIATSHLILGQYSCSMETSKKAAALQPMNFQAFHGAGITEFEQGNYENAAALFRQCLALNPWSSIATKLATTVDLLERRKMERLQG